MELLLVSEERKPLSLMVLQFLDDQMARLSSWGLRLESLWHDFTSKLDLETIGDFFSRRDSQVFNVLFWIFQPIVCVLSLIFCSIARLGKRLGSFPMFRPVAFVFSVSFQWLLRYPSSAITSFLIEFLRSREPVVWRYLGLAMLFLVAGAYSSFRVLANQSQVGKLYRQAVDHEIESGHLDRVYLYQLKLAQLGVDYGQPELEAVHQLELQGRTEEAYFLAEKLAPVDRPGMAEAHLYQVIACLRNDLVWKPAVANRLAESHLQHLQTIHREFAGTDGETPVEMKFLYAALRLNQDRVQEGMEILKEISPRFWPATIMCLEIHSRLQSESALEDSRNLLRLARLHPALLSQLNESNFAAWYRTLKAASLHLNPDNRQTLADLGCQFVAEQWCLQFPESPTAANTCFLEWNQEIETLAQQGLSEKSRAATLLIRFSKGIKIANRNFLADWLLPRLLATENNLRAGMWDVVREAVANSTAPICLLEVAGTAEFASGNHQKALELLTRVVNVEPAYAVAWNNLAVLIKRHRLEPIESAFEAAKRAVQLEPNNSEMRLTRAMIAIEVQDWQAAKTDLIHLLAQQPDNPELHRYLALSYQRLGETDQYHLHELLAGK